MITKEKIIYALNIPRSGYPELVKNLKHAGVNKYLFNLATGETIYYGPDDSLVEMNSGHHTRINKNSSLEGFIKILKNHQQGNTDYPTFCMQAAQNGIASWIADFEEMIVKYYDSSNNLLYEENIPEVN